MQQSNLELFFELVENQFQYGGQKYAQTETKEATDVLFDDFGKNWLIGTIAKYCKRYSNLARERDLLKIACYMFIIWLKRGFHISPDWGTYETINTTVETKSKYFDLFKERVKDYYKDSIINITNPLENLYNTLLSWSNKEFNLIPENDVIDVFGLSYYIWNKETKNKGTDKDTYNEGKEK